MARGEQLGLFGGAEPAGSGVGAAPVSGPLRALAASLPAQLRLGTSSWSFPGWRGIVFDRSASRTLLAREGLAAYAQHPLLRAVGLDRTFWAPVSEEVFRAYAAAVDEGFRFLVKAAEACTRPDSARFLDAEWATREVVRPCVSGLGERLGALLFQFPPLRAEEVGGPEGFAARVGRFLAALPPGPPYAVEVRSRALATRALDAALADAGAFPCFNVHPAAPGLRAQRDRRAGGLPPLVVVRWMLHSGFGYEAARARYAPFDRLIDVDPDTREELAGLCVDALARGRRVLVIANNKAEGSAPLSLAGLAEQIAGRLQSPA